jgi:hypothetical protein
MNNAPMPDDSPQTTRFDSAAEAQRRATDDGAVSPAFHRDPGGGRESHQSCVAGRVSG